MLTHRYADVNGVRLHYVTAGAGPLLLFLHGFPEFWYAWKQQLAAFAPDHQAVAPDMRGYNLSSKPADLEQYRMRHLVEDVRALALHLGHRRFSLVGHDWGGAVAWAFAIAHPEHLERLVIVNAPHPAVFQRELQDNPAQQQASRYMLTFRSPEAEALLAADGHARLVGIVLADGLRRGYFTEEDRQAYLAAWSEPGALTGGLNYYRAARVGPPTDSGEPGPAEPAPDPASLAVSVPTLVIWGERDQALLTGNLVGLDRFVPRLTIERIPQGTHWVVHEEPELVNGYIRRFLAGR
ncbi:MAG TPA: alpha/beta hydrolase [Methylomirabilota bacterium]|jgi:pimeloyl-ACP methyl ester carboxylesterase|nr:alpha/beta hydrolase [Methylomirabilota bacterium]HEV8675023.1 alpha/beta hydrolase [Methylomirabilota bacterium]